MRNKILTKFANLKDIAKIYTDKSGKIKKIKKIKGATQEEFESATKDVTEEKTKYLRKMLEEELSNTTRKNKFKQYWNKENIDKYGLLGKFVKKESMVVKNSDLMDKQFIIIFYEVLVTSPEIINVKKEMKEYSDFLKWRVKIDECGLAIHNKDKQKEFYYSIKAIPNNDKISPQQLYEKRDVIFGFIRSIAKDILSNELNKKSIIKTKLATKGKNLWIKSSIEDLLFMYYHLKEALLLHKENPKMSKSIFLLDIKEWCEKTKKELSNIKDGKARKIEKELHKILVAIK